MAGLFGLFAGGNAASASKPAYTIEHLQQLHTKLQQLVSTEEQSRENTMVEVVRQITEALIWGEQNGRDFFDFFCEKQILAEFVHILSLPRVAKTVKVQLLQTLSMLVQNIRRDTSLYYLFSNNYVNQLISTQLDWSDEEILSYYISFLKSLAMRLNPETVKFFFNERLEQFPLYVEAIRFFAHRDQMVRTAVRTLTLQVYSIKDPAMQSFVLALSCQTYFRHLTCYLRELWDRIDGATERAASWALPGGHYDQAAAAVLEANEQHKDLLMYISDVLDLEAPELSGALAAQVLKDALFPVLLGSLLAGASDTTESVSVPGGVAGEGTELLGAAADGNRIATAKHHVSRACALFVLHQVLDVCRSRALLEPLAAALLSESLPFDIQGYCMSSPTPPPATYRATTVDVSGPASSEGPFHATCEGALDEPSSTADGAKAARQRLSGRDVLLLCLGGCSGDSCALLAAGIFHRLLICHEPVLPEQPPPVAETASATASAPLSRRQPTLSRRHSLHALGTMVASHFAVVGRVVEKEIGQSSAAMGRRGMEEMSAKVLVLAVQALERNHASLRTVVLQALVQLVLDFSTEPAAWGRPAACAAARGAEAAAARELGRSLHEDGALREDTSDAFLDVFTEEWEEFQRQPALSVREVCSDARCLLPALEGVHHGAGMRWALSDPASERQQAAKAIRALLSIRRLQRELSLPQAHGAAAPAAPQPGASDGAAASEPALGGAAAPSGGPLHVAEEVADGYVEGKSVELGRQDRIVCGVVTPDGRHTRYLVLHPFLLLLVQPDLVSPGFAVVRTLAPVRSAEPHIDRSDPRTLRLHLRLTRGAACPGEASPFEPPPAGPARARGAAGGEPGGGPAGLPAVEERRGSSYFLLVLSFEDVKRCHNADYHLRRRRQEVREQLQKRLEALVDGLATSA